MWHIPERHLFFTYVKPKSIWGLLLLLSLLVNMNIIDLNCHFRKILYYNKYFFTFSYLQTKWQTLYTHIMYVLLRSYYPKFKLIWICPTWQFQHCKFRYILQAIFSIFILNDVIYYSTKIHTHNFTVPNKNIRFNNIDIC
jgi:hypothetical protein